MYIVIISYISYVVSILCVYAYVYGAYDSAPIIVCLCCLFSEDRPLEQEHDARIYTYTQPPNPKPQTPNPKPYTLFFQTLNPIPQTPNPIP